MFWDYLKLLELAGRDELVMMSWVCMLDEVQALAHQIALPNWRGPQAHVNGGLVVTARPKSARLVTRESSSSV